MENQMCGKLNLWKSVECNGLVYIWYHAENIEPSWQPVEVSHIEPKNEAKERWLYRGRNEFEV